MSAIELGASVVAILVLTGIAWVLGLGGGALDADGARQAAEDALPGFDAVAARVAADGSAALVTGADGSLAVVKRHGAQPAVRRVAAGQVRDDGDRLTVTTGERLFGAVTIR